MKKQKTGEVKIRHRQRDTTSVVSSVNSNVTRALTFRKPSKPQPKRRRTTNSLNKPTGPTPHEQPGPPLVPAPLVPTPHEQPGSSLVSNSQAQNEGRKRKRTQFYGFSEADISPTSSLASSSLSKTKKRKAEKQNKKSTATEESVVALIQNAEQSRIPSPPSPDLQMGQLSPPDSRIRYYEYEQEREMSVWDAENEI